MKTLFQPVAAQEGVNMGSPAKITRAPCVFLTRYMAKKWVTETGFGRYGVVIYKKVPLCESADDFV